MPFDFTGLACLSFLLLSECSLKKFNQFVLLFSRYSVGMYPLLPPAPSMQIFLHQIHGKCTPFCRKFLHCYASGSRKRGGKQHAYPDKRCEGRNPVFCIQAPPDVILRRLTPHLVVNRCKSRAFASVAKARLLHSILLARNHWPTKNLFSLTPYTFFYQAFFSRLIGEVWPWSMGLGNGFTFFHSCDSVSACHRSKFFCKLSQKSGVVSKARDKRKAISGVTDPLSFMILESVFLETPRVSAIYLIEMDRGKR